MAVYKSYLRFLEIEFNAKANGIEFKTFDNSLTHWLTNQGDDIVVEATTDDGRTANKKKIRKKSHTLSHSDHWHGRDFGIVRGDSAYVTPQENMIDVNGRKTRIIDGKKKINPIVYNGMKLNRARVIATFFVPNEENMPFVAVIDGDTNNLHASNLYWTENNLYPDLNHAYELEDIAHDLVIHSPSIRAMRENLNLYGWDKMFTRISVPIPNDLLMFFNQWKISIQSAVFTSLRYISQWSFTVFSIEYKEGSKVFVGYSPAMDGIYVDQIYKVAKEVPWLNDLMFKEGHGVLKVRYLTLSQTRLEAHDSCKSFMNDYHNKGWEIMNTDFYHPEIERELSVKLKLSELDQVNDFLMKEYGVDLQGYLNATVKKLKKKSTPNN